MAADRVATSTVVITGMGAWLSRVATRPPGDLLGFVDRALSELEARRVGVFEVFDLHREKPLSKKAL